MKKLLLAALMLLPLSLCAQKFAYVNSQAIFAAMPEYTKAQNDLQSLQKQYADEFERLRQEFQKKYEDFMQKQDSLPDNILKRRQDELQELNTRLQQYEQESYQNLQEAQQQKLSEVSRILTTAIQAVGNEGGYICVFDMAGGIPYISETLCDNVTDKVKAKLNIK